MPAAYEKMRDKFKSRGMSSKAAKRKAARIYNSKHPDAPVTGKHEPSAAHKVASRLMRERMRKLHEG